MSIPTIDLKLRMKQADITGVQLASEVGVTPSTISNWCKNKAVPHYHRLKVVQALAKYREPAKPRTKIRKSPTNMAKKRNMYKEGFNSALGIVANLAKVPADDATRLHLIKTLTSTGESR